MQNTVIQITNNGMGKGDRALQHKLIVKYLELIQSKESLPNAITFYPVDKVQVGLVGGMTDILEAQMKADKVITL